VGYWAASLFQEAKHIQIHFLDIFSSLPFLLRFARLSKLHIQFSSVGVAV
jgi:hypothetical protein